MGNLQRQALIEMLLNDQSYHIEFNGHLTNHNKHAVIALSRLGASQERIQAYYDNYAKKTPYGYGLEAPKIAKVHINNNNWKNYLGKRTSFSSFCNFFEQQEKELGMKKMLSKYIPILLPGWAGALTHATIHLGWALDINNRWMIIEGLAYMAFSYVSCHPARILSSEYTANKKNSVLDSLLDIAGVWEHQSLKFQNWVEAVIADKQHDASADIHPELVRSGLQYRITKLLAQGHPLIYEFQTWMNEQNIAALWKQLHYLVTLLYLVQPGDFLVLHLITSLHAMEQIAECLPVKQQKEVVKCFWVGMLCILFSRADFPKKTLLAELNSKYKEAVDDIDSAMLAAEWGLIIARALDEEEEHNPKLVYVLQRMWKVSGYRSIFRIAANYFTITPILPKSFEAPPIE